MCTVFGDTKISQNNIKIWSSLFKNKKEEIFNAERSTTQKRTNSLDTIEDFIE